MPTDRYVEAGGLVSFGTDNVDQLRRSAVYVDKILHGAKPADLPVEQPAQLRLAINRKAAKALKITIPRSVLVCTDLVIDQVFWSKYPHSQTDSLSGNPIIAHCWGKHLQAVRSAPALLPLLLPALLLGLGVLFHRVQNRLHRIVRSGSGISWLSGAIRRGTRSHARRRWKAEIGQGRKFARSGHTERFQSGLCVNLRTLADTANYQLRERDD